jgi:hypothetical protein
MLNGYFTPSLYLSNRRFAIPMARRAAAINEVDAHPAEKSAWKPPVAMQLFSAGMDIISAPA